MMLKQDSKKIFLLFICITLQAAIKTILADVDFKCPRGASCNTGTCNHATDACDCPAGRAGLQCQFTNQACATDQGCTAGGDEDAQCFKDDNNDDKCSCSAAYKGDLCNEKKVDVTCLEDRMTVHFSLYDGFNPVNPQIDWYADATENTKCENIVSGQKLGLNTGKDVVYGQKSFGTNCPEMTPRQPGQQQEISTKFCLQFNENMESDLDFCTEFTCKIAADGQIESVTSFLSNSNFDTPYFEVVRKEYELTAAFFEGGPSSDVQIAEGGTVKVGDHVTWRFAMKLQNGLFAYYLDGASVGATSASTDIVLWANGCPDPTNKNVLIGISTEKKDESPDPDVMYIYFQFGMFKIAASDEVHFSATVKLCTSACTAPQGCAPTSQFDQFTQSTQPGKRRKRDVSGQVEDGQEIKDINLSLRVAGSNGNQNGVQSELNQDVSPAECLSQISILVPFVAMAVLMIVSVACAVCLLVKRNNQERSRSKRHYPY